MANRNWSNGGKRYAMHASPVAISMSFEVDSTDPSGIKNLKGPAVADVVMNSAAATPSHTPNIQAGLILIQLQDNYNQHIMDCSGMIQSPTSGSDLKIDNSALTAGRAYVITTLGDATEAKWHSIGVPDGVEPAEGVSFIASTNGGAGNTLTSRVQISATTGSGIAAIEIVGDPNLSVAPDPSANQGFGAQVILRCMDYAAAQAAPADGSVITIELELNNSSLRVSGQ